MLKRGLRSEKLLSSDFRTGVRLPTPPPTKDSDIDTMSASSFLPEKSLFIGIFRLFLFWGYISKCGLIFALVVSKWAFSLAL